MLIFDSLSGFNYNSETKPRYMIGLRDAYEKRRKPAEPVVIFNTFRYCNAAYWRGEN